MICKYTTPCAAMVPPRSRRCWVWACPRTSVSSKHWWSHASGTLARLSPSHRRLAMPQEMAASKRFVFHTQDATCHMSLPLIRLREYSKKVSLINALYYNQLLDECIAGFNKLPLLANPMKDHWDNWDHEDEHPAPRLQYTSYITSK